MDERGALSAEALRKEAVRYTGRIARRYSPVAIGAGLLAVLAAFLPSTVPGWLLAGPAAPILGEPYGAATNGHHRFAPSVGTGAGGGPGASQYSASPLGGGLGNYGLPGGSYGGATGGGSYGSSGSAGGSGPNVVGSYTGGGGGGPSPIKTVPVAASQPQCPLPTSDVPGTASQVPQVDSLLLVVQGTCGIVVSLPQFVTELPQTVQQLPGSASSGSLPPAMNQLLQQLAFNVIIPAASAVPWPSGSPPAISAPVGGGVTSSAGPGASPVPAALASPGLPLYGSGLPSVTPGTAVPISFAATRVSPSGTNSSSASSQEPLGFPGALGRQEVSVVAGLVEGRSVAPLLRSQLAALDSRGVANAVEVIASATAQGGTRAFPAWVASVARDLPAGTALMVDTLALDPVDVADLPGATYLGPAPVASAVSSGLAAGLPSSLVGIALAGGPYFPSAPWWSALGADLRGGGSPPGGSRLAGIGFVEVETAAGSTCGSISGVAGMMRDAGLGGSAMVVLPGPASGGEAAAEAAQSCSVAAGALSYDAGVGSGAVLGVLQPLMSVAWK